MFLDYCRHVCIGSYGIIVGYGDRSADRYRLTSFVGFFGVVAVGPCYRNGVILTVVSSDTLFEVIALNEHFRVLAWVDAIASSSAAEIVVQHVNLANASHRHALNTAWSPPIESIGGV